MWFLKYIVLPFVLFWLLIDFIKDNESKERAQIKEITKEKLSSSYGKNISSFKANINPKKTYFHQERNYSRLLNTSAGLQSLFEEKEYHIFLSSWFDYNLIDIQEKENIFTYIFEGGFGFESIYEIVCDKNLMSYMIAAEDLNYDHNLLILHKNPVEIEAELLGESKLITIKSTCVDYIILDDEDLYEFREYFNDPTSLNIN